MRTKTPMSFSTFRVSSRYVLFINPYTTTEIKYIFSLVFYCFCCFYHYFVFVIHLLWHISENLRCKKLSCYVIHISGIHTSIHKLACTQTASNYSQNTIKCTSKLNRKPQLTSRSISIISVCTDTPILIPQTNIRINGYA